MQSKKRFTETNIWDDPVFLELTPKQKLFWFFLNDRCDNIGVWTPNPKLIAFNLDIEGNPRQFLDDFLKAINEGEEIVHVLPSGEWLINDFVKFQYCQKKPLHPNSPSHKSYLHLIEEKDLLTWFCTNYPETMPESYLKKEKKNSLRPLKDPFETYKDKEKDKDKETDKEKAQEKEMINSDLKAFENFAP
jgi:hypothetical protein